MTDVEWDKVTMPCPKCGRVMKARQNKDNGSRFMGCTGWPNDCQATAPIPAYVILKPRARRHCRALTERRVERALDRFAYPCVVVALQGRELVMLRIEIIRNLGSDPEQRYTQNGVAMTSIRVAVNSRRNVPDGEPVERTDWFRVRTMGSKAEYVQRFTKGQRVLVILEIGEWTTREGEARTSYDIWADDVVNLSPRDDGVRGHGESASAATDERAAQPAGAGARRASAEDTTDLDALPF